MIIISREEPEFLPDSFWHIFELRKNEHESVPFYRSPLICSSENEDDDDNNERESFEADLIEKVTDSG